MRRNFALTFLFHLVGLTILLIPNQYQGQVVMTLLGVKLRLLDLLGLGLIMFGSFLLNIYMMVSLRKQVKQIKQMNQANQINQTNPNNQIKPDKPE